MSTRYRYATTLAFGDDGEPGYAEVDVEVSYTVAWGSPETGAGYMADPYKYDPGSPDVVEDVRLELVHGRRRPWNLGDGWVPEASQEEMILARFDSDAHQEAMLQEAREREASWAA